MLIGYEFMHLESLILGL